MATKRYAPLDDPPSASSDDETEEEQEIIAQKTIHSSSSSSSSSEEEDDEISKPPTNPMENPKSPNPKLQPARLSSEGDSESDSESEKIPMGIPKTKTLSLNSGSIFEIDSDVRSPTASDFVIIPSKKSNAFETPVKTPTLKRRSSGSEIKNTKKMKVSNGDADDEKKAVSKRVWTVEDELMLLQGFIDYQSKIGCSPLSNMDGFYQFTMNCIPGHASKSQLYEKVRRLKKKFRVNSEKVSGNGEEPVFTKPHERTLFELSNKIWGIEGCENVSGGGSAAKGKVRASKVKPKIEVSPKTEVSLKLEVVEKDKEEEQVVKMLDFETLYPYWNAGLTSEVSSALKFPDGVVKLVKENLSLIGEAKAKEMNEKWQALFENETMLKKRRIALLSKVGDVETA